MENLDMGVMPHDLLAGSHLLPFSSSQVFPSTTVGSHGWSSAVVQTDGADPAALHNRNQQLIFLEKQNLFVEPSEHRSSNYKAAQPLAFLHGQSAACHGGGDLSCQPLLRNINTLSENGGDGGERNKMIYDRFTIGVGESDCALSLLSSPQSTQTDQTQAETPSGHLGLNRIEQRNAISLLQPLSHHHHHHHHHNSLETSDHSVRIPNDTHGHGAVNFPGIFGIGSNNAGNESPSTLPFHWE